MGPLSLGLGPFTTRGLDLLELVAACGKLVPVQSSLVDAWVAGSSTVLSFWKFFNVVIFHTFLIQFTSNLLVLLNFLIFVLKYVYKSLF